MSMGKSISSASFVRNDFSPVEHHVILSSVGKVTAAKFDEVFRECADSSSTRWNALSSTRWHWHMRLGRELSAPSALLYASSSGEVDPPLARSAVASAVSAENFWGAHVPGVLVSAPSPKRTLIANNSTKLA